jgi:hypothetical protein
MDGRGRGSSQPLQFSTRPFPALARPVRLSASYVLCPMTFNTSGRLLTGKAKRECDVKKEGRQGGQCEKAM